MKIIKEIKKQYFDEVGFPKYHNIEFFIECNIKYIEEKILPNLNIKNIGFERIIRSNLLARKKEQEIKIEDHKRYLEYPDVNMKDWELWNDTQKIMLNKLLNRVNKFDVNDEYNKYKSMMVTLFQERINGFKRDIANGEKEKKVYLDKVERAYNFFKENMENIFIISECWKYYVIYKNEEKLKTNKDKIYKLYNDLGVKLTNDKQFEKYSLISVNEFVSLNNNPPQIYDKRIERVILLKNSSQEIIKIFSELKQYINKLSIQPDSSSIYKGIKSFEFLLEHLEIGQKFSFDNLGEISIDKLCDDSYSNIIWVTKKENKYITFEELLDDFECEGNDVVTQVVHLEYFKRNGKYFIKHMDHEYIFYDLDTFEKRKVNSKIRGKRKVKTFKIDDSEIPFVMENGEVVLYKILNVYFENKDLLNEYFEKVL